MTYRFTGLGSCAACCPDGGDPAWASLQFGAENTVLPHLCQFEEYERESLTFLS